MDGARGGALAGQVLGGEASGGGGEAKQGPGQWREAERGGGDTTLPRPPGRSSRVTKERRSRVMSHRGSRGERCGGDDQPGAATKQVGTRAMGRHQQAKRQRGLAGAKAGEVKGAPNAGYMRQTETGRGSTDR